MATPDMDALYATSVCSAQSDMLLANANNKQTGAIRW